VIHSVLPTSAPLLQNLAFASNRSFLPHHCQFPRSLSSFVVCVNTSGRRGALSPVVASARPPRHVNECKRAGVVALLAAFKATYVTFFGGKVGREACRANLMVRRTQNSYTLPRFLPDLCTSNLRGARTIALIADPFLACTRCRRKGLRRITPYFYL
jgi:hypothetical protein